MRIPTSTAFASMLACRRLYPAAVVALSGSLNRNVREFYRLHADEIPCVEAARLELDAISRLVCVEATNPARLGDLEAVARRSDVDVVLFDHHRDERPDWLPQENVVLSDDGALTTTLVGIIAEREPAVTPLEATVFALGIHEDTGSLTYPTATQRDAEALAWCLRHGRATGDGLALPARAARRGRARAARCAARLARDPRRRRRRAVAGRGGVAGVRRRRLEPRPQGRRPHGQPRARVSRRDGGSRRGGLPSRTPEVDTSVLARALGGAGHPQASSAMYHGRSTRPGLQCSRRFRRRFASRPPRLRSCRAPRASYPPTTRSPTRWCCASAIARAVSRWARPRTWRAW